MPLGAPTLGLPVWEGEREKENIHHSTDYNKTVLMDTPVPFPAIGTKRKGRGSLINTTGVH